MENDELIAVLREVRERVRARNPQTAAGIDVALPDVMPLVHARDAAMGKVASIGTVNPRRGGPWNALVQAWKHLLARVLDWHVREQVEFNRNVVTYCDAVIEALTESNRALAAFGSALEAFGELNIRAASLEKLAAQNAAGVAQGKARLDAVESMAAQNAAELGDFRELWPQLRDLRAHWTEWRAGWEHKLSVNEIQFLRSLADLQGAFQHRVTLMDSSHREMMREHNADFHAALERHGFEIQRALWKDMERIVNGELRIIRQRLSFATLSPPPGDTAGSGAPAGPPATPAAAARADIPALDSARFAARFRGPEEAIHEKQAEYVALFKDRAAVLDIGCGRGEFLELLRAAGIGARGIDLNDECVAECRLKGLAAERADVFEYLAGLEAGALDGIFCAQVVEHIAPERLPEMIRLCARALARDGAIAIETPNPECLAIFSTYFYLDPTHLRPVPPPLLTFYLGEFGFGEIEVRKLYPAMESLPALRSLPGDFRDAFFGALDYAAIGRKL